MPQHPLQPPVNHFLPNGVVASVFAVPVLRPADREEDMLAARVPKFDRFGQRLHSQLQLGSASQGLYLVPELLSPSHIASLMPDDVEHALAEAMVEDCERVQEGNPSHLLRLLNLGAEAESFLPLRSVLGCSYRVDGLAPSLPDPLTWSAEAPSLEAELAVQSALGLAPAVLRRPTLRRPQSLKNALVDGLATFLTMDIDGDQAAPVDLVLEPDGAVSMRRCFASRVLQLSLGPNLLPPASIEALCATLGRMDPRAWEMTGTKH